MSSTPVGRCYLSSIFHRHYSLTFIQSVGIRNIPKADCFSCCILVTGRWQVYSKPVVSQQERGLDFHGRRRRHPHSVSAQLSSNPQTAENCPRIRKGRKAKKFAYHRRDSEGDSSVGSSDSEDEWRELHNYSATPYWPED